MSSTDRGRDPAPGKQQEPPASAAAGAGAGEPYPDWLDRVQRTRGRHAAITRNLNSWSSYKNWADRMRESWDDDAPPAADGSRAAGGTKPSGR